MALGGQTEVELKFLVPPETRAAIAAEMARKSASLERRRLAALYLDTAERHLARAGIAWRMRREGRRWVQTLKASGTNALERFEHEVSRPGPAHDASAHAGTRIGDKLIRLLSDSGNGQLEIGVRFQTDIWRISRRIGSRGALVEVAFDEGKLLSNEQSLRVREVEFELVSGSASAMLILAKRWRKRFGLIYDPRSKAERGDRLAQGSVFSPIRKAQVPEYSRDASAVQAFGTVLDECLAHISRNAICLVDGDRESRIEHVHQVRIGIRRLRSALRSFEEWVPAAPQAIIDEVRSLFVKLGRARDSDILASGVAAELEKVGAPALALPDDEAGPDLVAMVRAANSQNMLLDWIAWRMSLADAPSDRSREPAEAVTLVALKEPGVEQLAAPGDQQQQLDLQFQGRDDAKAFHRNVEKRLRRWHRRIVADYKDFDNLEEEGLHSLRKRIKRQRYAVEFFAPVLRRRGVERYLKPLTLIQDRMGQLNDLMVARGRYQSLVASEPAAWFALGWLAARLAEVRIQAEPELKAFAKADPPAPRRSRPRRKTRGASSSGDVGS